MRSRRSPTRSVGRSSLGCPADRHGQRARRALRDQQAGGQQAHPGARAGRPRHPDPGRATPTGPPQPGRLEALTGLDRPLPARPRAAVPCARRAARPSRTHRNHRRSSHEQRTEPRHPRRCPVDRLHPRVRRAGRGRLQRASRPGTRQAVARPARLRDGDRSLGLPFRRRLPLRAQDRPRCVRLPRHVPHDPRERPRRSRPSSSRVRPTRSPSSS